MTHDERESGKEGGVDPEDVDEALSVFSLFVQGALAKLKHVPGEPGRFGAHVQGGGVAAEIPEWELRRLLDAVDAGKRALKDHDSAIRRERDEEWEKNTAEADAKLREQAQKIAELEQKIAELEQRCVRFVGDIVAGGELHLADEQTIRNLEHQLAEASQRAALFEETDTEEVVLGYGNRTRFK